MVIDTFQLLNFLKTFSIEGRIVNITSATGTIFISKCRDDVQTFLNTSFSLKDVETRIIEPFLKIVEDHNICMNTYASLALVGLTDFELIGPGYGLSKAALNVFTRDLAEKNPHLVINACCPGFVDSDLSRGVMERNNATPEQFGMKSTESGAVAPVFLMMEDVPGSGDYYGEGGKVLDGGLVALANDRINSMKQA